eukprot:TRINITY_DN3004_c0_g1_i1.p1 TRINITY_DN3004_c0_g1~~TRINITY_DN3004_c0_g1_i1.p1  ORF type:complete len:1106 (-),score=187.22 TRINITY_DN3004_c0_g1_i1:135-3116(-)
MATGRRLVMEDDNGKARDLDLSLAQTQSPSPDILSSPRNSEANKNLLPKASSPVLEPSSNPPTMGAEHGRSSNKSVAQLCEVSSADRAFLVFRSLPIVIKKCETSGGWQVEKISHGAGTALPLLKHFTDNFGPNRPPPGECVDVQVKFVGSPGVCVESEAERKELTELLAKHSCIPVFLDRDVVDKHNAFNEEYLWPVFHNMKIFDSTITGDHRSQSFDKDLWDSFQKVSNAYAEVITAHGDDDTLVWVHDYELLMLPRHLYNRRPDWNIGLFLHCAFPSTEVMRCLPVREDLMQSMLSARMVTFQIFDYLRHFMSCCTELLGARHSFQKGGILTVEHESRSVAVMADHFAIPYSHLVKRLSDEKVVERAKAIRDKFGGKKIIGAYDRGDCFSGIMLKLRIFHRFLADYRQYRSRIVLVQYIRTPKTKGRGAVDVEELHQMAENTNKTFGVQGEPPLVTIVTEDITRERNLGVMMATDILLDTSTNDGLNLAPFNFYAAHSEDKKGVVIVSEFCGCSSVLTGAFKINPWHTTGVLEALDKALSITAEDQALRFTKDHSYVSTQTLVHWVEKNLSELKATQSNTQKQHRSFVGPSHLDFDEVMSAYSKAKNRAIFLDNEGTIAANAGWKIQSGVALKKRGYPPDRSVLDQLQTLASDRSNTVVVLSGRGKDIMEEWFGSVDGLGLCAEHGFHRVLPAAMRSVNSTDTQDRWSSEALFEDDEEWKALVTNLMEKYVRRVQGSILETKSYSISWNYREVGATGVVDDIALDLARFLDPNSPKGLLCGYPVKVVSGKGYVEVRRGNIDKGTSVTKMLEQLGKVDFVLCIGDDRSDEDMFEAVSSYFGPMSGASSNALSCAARGNSSVASMSSLAMSISTPPVSPKLRPRSKVGYTESEVEPIMLQTPAAKWFTATVGRKASKAKHFVANVDEVSRLLQKLASKSIVSSFSRFASMPNFTAADLAGNIQDDSEEEEQPQGVLDRTKTGGLRIQSLTRV